MYTGKLCEVTVRGRGVGLVEGIVVALEGFGCMACLVVGAAKEVVGKEAVVGGAVFVEEADEGVGLLHSEGLIVAVALIEAVQAGAHAAALGLGGAAGECGSQEGYIYNKV